MKERIRTFSFCKYTNEDYGFNYKQQQNDNVLVKT